MRLSVQALHLDLLGKQWNIDCRAFEEEAAWSLKLLQTSQKSASLEMLKAKHAKHANILTCLNMLKHAKHAKHANMLKHA